MCADGPGDLCRYGKTPAGHNCDPDSDMCEPWRCDITFGEDPGAIYKLEKEQVGK